MRFDVAIIGAGMSGLAAGVRLAHFGKKVVILERHTVFGGLNSFYKKRGYHFDTGLHAMTNWVAPGHRGSRLPLQRVLRQLRIRAEDLNLEPQTHSEIVFPGCRLTFENGLERLTAEIRRAFPADLPGFLELCARTAQYPDALADAPRVSGRLVLSELIKDPLLVEMLLCPLLYYGSAEVDDLDFTQLVILFNSIFREGFCRPRAGVKPVLFALVRRFEEAGGVMLRGDGVRSIRVDGGRVSGLELESGQSVTADLVISTAGLTETARLRSDRSGSGSGSGSASGDAEARGQIAFTESVFVLDRPPSDFGHRPAITFFSNRVPFRFRPPEGAPVDVESGVICCPDNFAHREPLEQHHLRVTHLADPAAWLGFDEADYRHAKEVWLARSTEAIERHTGPFRSFVKAVDSFTPRTVRKYTGHDNGAVYGSPRKQRSGRTDLQNLFLAGTDQGLLGIVGAMLSGISVANAYVLPAG